MYKICVFAMDGKACNTIYSRIIKTRRTVTMTKVIAANKKDSKRVTRAWWIGDVSRLQASRARMSNEIMYPVAVTVSSGTIQAKDGWAVGK